MRLMSFKKTIHHIIIGIALVAGLSECFTPRDIVKSMISLQPDYRLNLQTIYQTTAGGEGCLSPDLSDSQILLIPIQGVIQSAGYLSNSHTSPAYIERVLRLARNENLDAILLHINSPGGTVTASHRIYRQISDFAKANDIPVYVHVSDLNASGAYYISMSAKEINAAPTARVGSIGVIMRSISLQGLIEKYGIKYQSIASGENKDMGSIFKDLTEEEKQFLKSQIDRSYEQFISIILNSRSEKLNRNMLIPLADGRVYLAKYAQQEGLIDSIGSFEEYIAKIANGLGKSNPKVVAWLPNHMPAGSVYELDLASDMNVNYQIAILKQLSGNQMYYIWKESLF